MELLNLPNDMLRYEIVKHLDFKSLLNLALTNIALNKIAVDEIIDRLEAGELAKNEYSLDGLLKLGKSNHFLIPYILLEIDRRLNYNVMLEITTLLSEELRKPSAMLDRYYNDSYNFTIDDIKNHFQGKSIDWYKHSKHVKVTLDEVLQHPEIPWNWSNLSRNKNITFDDYLAHPELHDKLIYFQFNAGRTFPEFLALSDKDIIDKYLAFNSEAISLIHNFASNSERITIEDIITHPELHVLANNLKPYNITMRDLELYEKIIFEDFNLRKRMAVSPHITREYMSTHPEFLWEYYYYQLFNNNPRYNVKELIDMIDKGDIDTDKSFGSNPAITAADILAYQNINWYGQSLEDNDLNNDPNYIAVATEIKNELKALIK